MLIFFLSNPSSINLELNPKQIPLPLELVLGSTKQIVLFVIKSRIFSMPFPTHIVDTHLVNIIVGVYDSEFACQY